MTRTRIVTSIAASRRPLIVTPSLAAMRRALIVTWSLAAMRRTFVLPLLAAAAATAACETRPESALPVPADSTPGAPEPPSAAADTTWPEPGTAPIAIRRTRSLDLTGDGRAEQITVHADGARYDSLDIALTVLGAAGDTLWREQWPSLLYFVYDGREGKADTTIARIVRAHVDTLLTDVHFESDGGLPAPLRRGGNPDEIMREAVQYHLAELDWRRQARVAPSQPTPVEAYSAIDASTVTPARVAAVLDDIRSRPSFMYYAGGEATYAIAWSERERAFVRIYSCC